MLTLSPVDHRVSDTGPSEGVTMHMRRPLPQALRLQAQACDLLPGILPGPGLRCPEASVGPPPSTLPPCFKSLPNPCHFFLNLLNIPESQSSLYNRTDNIINRG